MIESPFRVLIADYSSHAILLIDIPTGEVLNEIPYPSAIRPIAIAVTEDKKTAYIPAAKNGGCGILFALSLETQSLYHLPVELPHPVQFALAPGGRRAYLAGPDSTLYGLDLMSMELTTWGYMPEDCTCAGIAANDSEIYTVWEHEAGGTLAIFNRQGQLQVQHPFTGTPTSITLTKQGLLVIPYTSAYSGEGVTLFRTIPASNNCPAAITLQCSYCARGVRVYPNHAAISPDESTLYIVNEDSSSLSIINALQSDITGCIPIGHSLSQIAVSGDGCFAAGASNAFADLCLIDLVNRRLLSITDTTRELSGFLTAV